MSYETILVERRDGSATVTLNRPDKLNSFNERMHGELRDALAELAEDGEVRALLLTGSGRGFCAGQDLAARPVQPDGAPPALRRSIETYYNPLVRRLRGMDKPVVCAVNGIAAGAGANIALACDIVLAARSASFIQAFCKIGLVPDSGGTWTLPRLVGMARARALALLGDKGSAEPAEAGGMIWNCVDDAELMPQASAIVAQLANGPTKGLGFIKKALDAAATNDLDAQLDLECEMQAELGRSHDYREGVAAFVGKRAPKFEGR